MTATEEEELLRLAPAAGEGDEGDEEAEPGAVAKVEDDGSEPEPKPPKLLQEPLPGDWDVISSEFGGTPPDVSEIRVLGGKMPIEGSFNKGDEFDILVRVRVTGVLGQDIEDAYGTKQHTVRRHLARMVSVRRWKAG